MRKYWLFESYAGCELVGFLRSESAFMINFSLMVALLSKCTFEPLHTNEVFKMITTRQMRVGFSFLNFCKVPSVL